MKKISSSADLGGAPFYKSDFREVFNQDIWAAIEGMMTRFTSESQGMIVSGCELSDNGGNFDMTDGVVFLNGEFMRIEAVFNQSFPKYIVPSSVVDDERVFADTTSHVLFQTKGAELADAAPGSGQYITIASLAGPAPRRMENAIIPANKRLRTHIVEIGSWNMTNGGRNVNHGLPGDAWKNVVHISAVIRNDSDNARYPLNYFQSTSDQVLGGIGVITSTFVSVRCNENVFFNNGDFDDTEINRGWIYIVYLEGDE